MEFSNIIFDTLVSGVLPSSFLRRPFDHGFEDCIVTSGLSELSVVEKFR